jgi:hypothetical protein
MVRFGPSLERKQAVLGRIVEIGAELFVMVTTIVRAKSLVDTNPSDRSPYTLADLFCRQSKGRIQDRFDRLFANNDSVTYGVAQQVMAGRFEWVEEGLVRENWIPVSDREPATAQTLEGPPAESTPAAGSVPAPTV